jgi:hypothetical protein
VSIYPEECLQSWVTDKGSWWDKDTSKELRPGNLIWAFIPHIDLIPHSIEAHDRGDNYADHSTATFKLTPLRIKSPPPQKDKLPVAALPLYPGERHIVYKGKKRPAIVLSTGGTEVPKSLISSMKPKSQTRPTITVAPYYGVQPGKRAGWYEPFVAKIMKCEFPQYAWDILPLPGETDSILRFDHVQPIGRHHDSYELTGYTLNQDALDIMYEWVHWLATGKLVRKGSLNQIRNSLLDIDC